MDTGGGGHLDNSALAIAQQADKTLYLVAKGGSHFDRQNAASGGIDQ